MKKSKLLLVLLMLVGVIVLSGCEKGVSAVCKKTIEYEKQTNETIVTMKFDDNQILNKEITKVVEKHLTEDAYKNKKEIYDDYYNNLENKDIKYTYNDKKKTVIVETTSEYNFSDSDKSEYKANKHISNYEEMGYTCTIKGASRKSLGLK